MLDGGFDQLVTILSDFFSVRLRNRHLGKRLAHVIVVENDPDLPNQVDVTSEGLARTDRQLERERLLGETAADHLETAVEIRPNPVHLVRENDPGDPIPVGLAPHGFRLGLDAGHRVEQRHGAVEHPKRTLHLGRKVDMPGGVDDVDPVLKVVVGPETGRGGRGNRDTALLLLLHPVHRGRAVVDFTDLVVLAGVIEDALGRSRLPSINVGHDADVAIPTERCFPCHSYP